MVRRWSLLGFAAWLMGGEADWPRFRGPNGSGVSETRGVPVEFGPRKNVVWKAETPPGHSSPILVKDRIFLTGYGPSALYTICLDRHTGREMWRRELARPKPAAYHRNNNPASPTPASDGTSVFVFFQEAGLLAYDLTGGLVWHLDLALPRIAHGMGTSPIVAGDSVILNCDSSNGNSFLIAVDKNTGRVRWRTRRDEMGLIPGYATPVLDGDAVVVPGSLQWAAYEIRTGKKTWQVEGLPSQPKGSAIVVGDVVIGGAPAFADGAADETFSFARMLMLDSNHDGAVSRVEATTPLARKWLDLTDENGDGQITESEWNSRVALLRGRNTLFAVRPGRNAGDRDLLWKREIAVPYVTTPICYRGILYLIKEGGVLISVDPKTGAMLERTRLTGGAVDQYFASPVAADGRLYLVSQAGHLAVMDAGPKLVVLGVNDLEEECYATPAIGHGRLYLRTSSALYCFGSAERP